MMIDGDAESHHLNKQPNSHLHKQIKDTSSPTHTTYTIRPADQRHKQIKDTSSLTHTTYTIRPADQRHKQIKAESER